MSAQETKKQKKKRPRDLNRLAEQFKVVQAKIEKNLNAVQLGRLGGLKGGKARAEKLTPEERSEIARKAAGARWATR